ncbi:putative methyltransferase C9orf114 homolog [Diachasma alloeum]|uniref:putative methyltransferase C9orf114 homolog n=1 Tax=Diachasma alloeum TaxID=454923 RepID=UPI000738277D|nr:putative methyltransferase C9orf114 homolog [Diachasma alloeum]
MAATVPQGKSWKEHNRIHKEKRKKWREERLVKKSKKETETEVKAEEKPQKKPEKIQMSTLSIAVPGSVLENAQSPELRTYLAGQIARAACIYKVDEVIVFDDQGEVTEGDKKKLKKDEQLGEARAACLQLARILQYLECPQYLRKFFFPLHKDLQYAGVLNPLDAPHHLRASDVSVFREGVVTNKPIKAGRGSQVNVGLLNDVHIDKMLTPGLRVTLRIPLDQDNPKRLKGTVVAPTVPRSETGIYWGYTVRLASSITEVFSRCPYEKGYDLTIGTSDKGSAIDEVPSKSLEYNHGLVVFGGLAGLEAALEADPCLSIDDPSLLFDKYLNTCPEQGSRTIRTEEAILVSLSEVRGKLKPKHPALSNPQFPVHNEQQSHAPNSDDKSSRTKNSNEKNEKKTRIYHSDSSGGE